jgi:nucleoside-diphosphate-sugar epimerase
MRSAHPEPLNVGSERLVTVDGLVDLVAAIAGKRIRKRHDPSRPQGVRGRCSDNTRLRAVLDWEPRVALEEGLRDTYAWIAAQVAGRAAARDGDPSA